MKKTTFLIGMCFLLFLKGEAQETFRSIRPENLHPDSHCWLVDPHSSPSQTKNPYRFSSLKKALLAADSIQRISAAYLFSEEKPLSIYLAPSVYWIDDPEDPTVRRPLPGEGIPYGMKLRVSHLRLVGLGSEPAHTVVASNRGQTQGAVGNFTMFHFTGEDLHFENLTLGNYCNVDLVYPLNPSFNRKRRAEAIVQAQLAICNGDRISARNCRFISRLNSCPLVGARRTFFEDCYFECTDDALCGTGIYHRCRFTLFSGKPFYNTQGTGAIFLDCDLHSLTRGKQYLVKVGSPVTMIDCRWSSESPDLTLHWTPYPSLDQRSYLYNLTLNGHPVIPDQEEPELTVDLTEKPLLEAFRIVLPKTFFRPGSMGDTVVYNLRNLLRGKGEWNPSRQPDFPEKYQGRPLALRLSKSRASLESGVDTLRLQACRPGFMERPDFSRPATDLHWEVKGGEKAQLCWNKQPDGTLLVTAHHEGETPETLRLTATSSDGAEAACLLTVRPRQLPPPAFIEKPLLRQHGENLTVSYTLDLQGRIDRSHITWARSLSPDGTNAIPVSVSHTDNPKHNYQLTAADNGYYLLAYVTPQHQRSEKGATEKAATPYPIHIQAKEVTRYNTDFADFPTERQPRLLPGFWSVDSYKPIDTQSFEWEADTTRSSWHYGEGTDGARGEYGLIQSVRGARLRYTPLEGKYGDMELTLTVSPCKSAGQGFGSATGQYMDIGLKMDTRSLTGYALRIERTTRHDKAVEFRLMRYEQGKAIPLSAAVSSICYRKDCLIRLKIKNGKFTAHVRNLHPLPPLHRPDLTEVVKLEIPVPTNSFGGLLIQHTGSTGASATVLKMLEVEWE